MPRGPQLVAIGGDRWFMKPFHFSLESVRTLRRHSEDTASRAYAQALRASERARELLEHCRAELGGSWSELRRQTAVGTSGAELSRLRDWCRMLEGRAAKRATALEEAQREVSAARQKLVLACRERQSLDRLHARSLKAHAREAQREEQRNLDELALQLAQSPISKGLTLTPVAGKL